MSNKQAKRAAFYARLRRARLARRVWLVWSSAGEIVVMDSVEAFAKFARAGTAVAKAFAEFNATLDPHNLPRDEPTALFEDTVEWFQSWETSEFNVTPSAGGPTIDLGPGTVRIGRYHK